MAKFEEIFTLLKNLTFERHLFHTRKQRAAESISSFVIYLKNMARKCEFGGLERELIKDRIVCGITSDAVRKTLFREASLTSEKTLSICCASELAEKQVKNLASNGDIDGISSVRSFNFSQRNNMKDQRGQPCAAMNNCRNCGDKHLARQCPAFSKTCHNCNKKNHFARVCFSVKRNQQRVAHSLDVEEGEVFIGTVEMPIKQSNETVEDKVCDSPEVNNSSKVEVRAVEGDNDEWYSTLKFGEESVKLKIDTGAKCNEFPQKNSTKSTKVGEKLLSPR